MTLQVDWDRADKQFVLARQVRALDAARATEGPAEVSLGGPFFYAIRAVTDYMCSIITCPNPEHETCVAPSIRRAKS